MESIRIRRTGRHVPGEIRVPGDKSMSHRAAILASLSNGRCGITGFLPSGDCLATLEGMRALGADIRFSGGDKTSLEIAGHGLALSQPEGPIDCGNSGTMMRLFAGLLAPQPFSSRLIGDDSLSGRPMNRIIKPLSEMGAEIEAQGEAEGCAPLLIRGRELRPITYQMPVASAQVKSAVLLAGLFTAGKTTVLEPVPTRDHTERMMGAFLVKTLREGKAVSVYGGQTPESRDFYVPGDLSSAAFWLVAGAASPKGDELSIPGVGLNDTRAGVLGVLIRMGARVCDHVEELDQGEPYGTVSVRGGELRGIVIEGKDIPNVIDELPVLAVAGALADGVTVIRDASELRVKESDRITCVAENLRRMGVNVREFEDGMEIEGGAKLRGAVIPSYGDHRIAMAFAIAGLFAEGETVVEDTACVGTSYPGFVRDLEKWMA